MKAAAFALASIALSVGAQFLMKRGVSGYASAGASDTFTLLLQPWVAAGLVCYALGAALWLQVLARWDVSKAYPLVGLGFVLTLFIGLLLGEAVSWRRVLGVLMICGGVVLVAKT
jgi:drug/metabolite transporter (DMT)-like permease